MKALMLSAIAAASLFAGAATAAVLTFEGTTNTIYRSEITRDGFDIGVVANSYHRHVRSGRMRVRHGYFYELDSDRYPGFAIPNGSGILYSDRDQEIYIEASDGAAFSLGTFDAGFADRTGTYGWRGGAYGVAVEGFLNGVSVGVLTLSQLGSTYATGNGAGLFGNVDRLVFDGTGGDGGFALDNIALGEVSPVPLPAGLPMILAGLGAFGFLRSRKKA